MRTRGIVAAAAVALGVAFAEDPARTWNFEGDPVDAPPAGFTFSRTGQGRPGKWIVRVDPDAPAGVHVLAQVDDDRSDYRYPVAVADTPVLKDLRLEVRCKQLSGKTDQACGVVFRYRGENDYYVARANSLEDNVRIYKVVSGRRRELGSWDGKVATGTWHALAVEARGDRFVVSFDGKPVIEARDDTFREAGKVGLWTKADSVTEFDALSVKPLL
jgi:hypothetical protein